MNKFVKSREFKVFQLKFGLLTEEQFMRGYDVSEKHLNSLIKSNLRRFEGKFYFKAFGVVFLDPKAYERVLQKEAQIKFNKQKGVK